MHIHALMHDCIVLKGQATCRAASTPPGGYACDSQYIQHTSRLSTLRIILILLMCDSVMCIILIMRIMLSMLRIIITLLILNSALRIIITLRKVLSSMRIIFILLMLAILRIIITLLMIIYIMC